MSAVDKNIAILLRAKKIYDHETDNDPIMHSNRFPAWHELPKEEQEKYIKRAKELS